MTVKQLAKEIAKREGLKKSVDITQIQEILGHLSDIVFAEFQTESWDDTWDCFYYNGANRAKKSNKK